MSAEEFAERLRKWRGKRYQKEVSDLLNTTLRTYQSWEGGQHSPGPLAMAEIIRLMELHEEQ